MSAMIKRDGIGEVAEYLGFLFLDSGSYREKLWNSTCQLPGYKFLIKEKEEAGKDRGEIAEF